MFLKCVRDIRQGFAFENALWKILTWASFMTNHIWPTSSRDCQAQMQAIQKLDKSRSQIGLDIFYILTTLRLYWNNIIIIQASQIQVCTLFKILKNRLSLQVQPRISNDTFKKYLKYSTSEVVLRSSE